MIDNVTTREEKTKVSHVDIAKSEVVKARFKVNSNAQKDRHDKVIAQLSHVQDPVRQIPRRGIVFIFECETCGNSYVEPQSMPSEECVECGDQVHIVEMPADLWDERYEVDYK